MPVNLPAATPSSGAGLEFPGYGAGAVVGEVEFNAGVSLAANTEKLVDMDTDNIDPGMAAYFAVYDVPLMGYHTMLLKKPGIYVYYVGLSFDSGVTTGHRQVVPKLQHKDDLVTDLSVGVSGLQRFRKSATELGATGNRFELWDRIIIPDDTGWVFTLAAQSSVIVDLEDATLEVHLEAGVPA